MVKKNPFTILSLSSEPTTQNFVLLTRHSAALETKFISFDSQIDLPPTPTPTAIPTPTPTPKPSSPPTTMPTIAKSESNHAGNSTALARGGVSTLALVACIATAVALWTYWHKHRHVADAQREFRARVNSTDEGGEEECFERDNKVSHTDTEDGIIEEEREHSVSVGFPANAKVCQIV